MSGEIGRLAGVFGSPGEAMKDIAPNGKWWLVALLMIAVSFGSYKMLTGKVSMEQMIRQQIEQSGAMDNVPAEQKERVIEQQSKFAPIISMVGIPVGTVVLILLIAGILLAVFKVAAGADLKYGAALNVTAYSMLPASIVGSLAAMLVIYLKDARDIDPQHLLAFNVGAFLPDTAGKALKALGGAFDLFTFWVIAVMAIGFSVACGSNRVPVKKSATLIVAVWAVWVVIRVGFAAVVGR
jgi:hypothetical protein